jgi:hypothetical protein
MPAAWESGTDEERWSDRETWRGDLHPENVDYWRTEPEAGFVWNGEEEVEEEEPEAEADWPEDLAGPEYWMFKNLEE